MKTVLNKQKKLAEKGKVGESDGGHCFDNYRASQRIAYIVAAFDLQGVGLACFKIKGLLSAADA